MSHYLTFSLTLPFRNSAPFIWIMRLAPMFIRQRNTWEMPSHKTKSPPIKAGTSFLRGYAELLSQFLYEYEKLMLE